MQVIVGDVHGCIDELNELLKLLSYDKNKMKLILAGDLLDRGPDSVAVVRKARELNAEATIGNHEVKFLKWLKNPKPIDEDKKHYELFSEEDIRYIKNMQPYYKLDNNSYVIHAGMRPRIPIHKQNVNDLMFLRYTTKDGKFISIKKVLTLGKEACDAVFWTELWTGDHNIVYGHNVHSMDNIYKTDYDTGNSAYGIDTGCCFGGHLTAMIWETKEIVQVKAKKVYYKPGFEE